MYLLHAFQQATGKTLLARTLAKVLDVPFSVSDATSFTQVCLSLIPALEATDISARRAVSTSSRLNETGNIYSF